MAHTGETEPPPLSQWRKVGGRLCLDFINTVDSWQDPNHPGEYLAQRDALPDYRRIVEWAQLNGVIKDAEAETLQRLASEFPNDAAAIHERTLTFREALHTLLTDYIHGREADPASMAVINFEIADTFSQTRLWWYDGGFSMEQLSYDNENQELLDEFLEPVVLSAIELLTAKSDVAKIRECDGEDCGWLFFDSSGRRRWCSMEHCGNAAKVRRFRERQKTAIL